MLLLFFFFFNVINKITARFNSYYKKTILAKIIKLASKMIMPFLIIFMVLGSFFYIINDLKSFSYFNSTLVKTLLNIIA